MPDHLHSFHRAAAAKSGGIASMPIYATIESTLIELKAHGRLLDFGAGKGQFTRRLHASGRFSSVDAIDILDRPIDLPSPIVWQTSDLNSPSAYADCSFDVIVASEVIEHLENPRAVVREWKRLLKPKGLVVMSTPNNENIRSFISLWFRGNFWAFSDSSYPAHITALTRQDISRVFLEAGLRVLGFWFTDNGHVPGITRYTWQQLSFGFLRGLRFSDNVVAAARKA